MVAVYIDPDSGSNSNAGTEVAPWANFDNLPAGTWDEAYVKRDTIMTVSARARLLTHSNKYIGAYGSGAKPVIQCHVEMTSTAGWVEVDPVDGVTPASGTNLWAYEFNFEFWNPPTFVNFGTLGAYGIRKYYWEIGNELGGTEDANPDNAPSAYGEYDYLRGSATGPVRPRLLVYAVGNPVTYYGTIYYQLGNQPALLLANCTNITVQDLKVMHSYALVRAEALAGGGSSNINFLDIEAELASYAVEVYGASNTGWVDGFTIRNIVARNMLCDAIIPHDYIKNGIIEGNNLQTCGLVESAAAIYIGTCHAGVGEGIHIRSNTITDQQFGNFWDVDGHCIMLDSNSSNVWVYRNTMTNSFAGLKSNSGASGNRFYSNVSDDVDMPFQEGDSAQLDGADTRICNNTFLNCHMYKHASRPTAIEQQGAIAVRTQVATPASRYHIINNIVTCVPGTGTNAFATDNALYNTPAVTIADNVIHGHSLGYVSNGVEKTLDASNSAADPLVDSDYRISPLSPAFRSGSDWWTALSMSPVDYSGLPLAASRIDAGARSSILARSSTSLSLRK